jgi:benzylsuccinate CoA-transferase BbsF subunit
VYVSNCGFGHTGPYRPFKTWGPVVQAMSGLTFTSGLPDEEPAGWGFSYMDHIGAYYMALGILAALHHRERTGEGQWVDLATVPAGVAMLATEVLDWTVNGRPGRRPGQPHAARADFDEMAPHGIYPTREPDRWVAITCRDQADLMAVAWALDEPALTHERFASLPARVAAQDELDGLIRARTVAREPHETAAALRAAGVPVSVVASPEERIDNDDLLGWGLFPTVRHPEIGPVRVEGLPLRLSDSDWHITSPAPCLGEHNAEVFGGLLGHSDAELTQWHEDGVI